MRVLVVEDDPDLCEVLRDFLLDVGHEPLIVYTAEAALDRLRVERPDAVLLDVRLPGMSGLDFLRLQAVRELRVPILVMSGNVTEHQARECLQLGAFDFIGKPLPLSRLEELLACLGPAAATTGSAPEPPAPGRRAPRVPVVLPVTVHESNGTEWPAMSVNLSASGIKIRSHRAVQPGPAARLSLTLPDPETRLEVVSVLVRTDLDGHAFYFLNLTDEQLERLSALVQRLESDQPTPPGPHLPILQTISQALGTSLDVDEVLRIALDALTHVTGHEISSLHLLAPDGTTLHLRGDRGLRPPLREINRVLPVGEGVIGRVAATGHTMHLADVSESPDLLPDARAVVKQEGIHAFVCVAIRSRGRILGTLSLGRRTPESFSELEVDLVEASAHQIGLALENVRLFGESERRYQAANSLADVGRLISQSLDPGEVQRRVVDSLLALFGARMAAFFRLEAPSGDLVTCAVAGGLEATAAQPLVLPDGTGVSGLAVRERRPVVTANVLDDPRVALRPEARAQITRATYRAVLAVPVLLQERVIGALAVGDLAGRVFSAEEIRLAQAFADQAAIALENARLYAEATAHRREAEAARLEAEATQERFRLLVNTLGAVVWEADPVEAGGDGESPRRFSFVSRGAEMMLGYPVGRWLATPEFWVSLIHPGDRDRVLAACRAQATGGHELEYRLLTADGRVVWVVDFARPLQEGVGPGRLRGMMVDITRRKIAEEGQRLQSALTSVLAEAATFPEAIEPLLQTICERAGWDLGEMWLLDGDAGILRRQGVWRAASMAGPEAVEPGRPATLERGRGLPGRTWAHGRPLWIPDVASDPECLRTPAAPEGCHAALSCPIYSGGGLTGVMVFFSRHVLPPNAGLLASIEALGAQLGQFAERKRTEAALRQSEEQFRQAQKIEAVGHLVGGIAHDFNNVLTVIKGRAALLLNKMGATSPLREDAQLIEEAADRAADLTNQILAFSRRQVLEPRVLDPNHVVATTATMLERMIGEDIELTIVPGRGGERVHADPNQLGQVVMNLVVNARDAMPHGGRLTIEVRSVELDDAFVRRHPGAQAGPHVMLAVSDTGCGMDAETMSRIFEPFFTTKEAGKGTGLGLSTVYQIVKQHYGCILVESEPRRGTTVRIYLPRVEGTVAPDERGILPGESWSGSETLLLVEDRNEVRAVMADILRFQGYTVLEAGSPAEALTIVERHAGALDLLVTDVIMPGMSGPDLARDLTTRGVVKRVVYVSGYVDDETARAGVLADARHFLFKPFTPEALARKVREALDDRAPDAA